MQQHPGSSKSHHAWHKQLVIPPCNLTHARPNQPFIITCNLSLPQMHGGSATILAAIQINIKVLNNSLCRSQCADLCKNWTKSLLSIWLSCQYKFFCQSDKPNFWLIICDVIESENFLTLKMTISNSHCWSIFLKLRCYIERTHTQPWWLGGRGVDW